MVTVTTDSTLVTFEVEGWDKVWALTGKLIIPLEHVKSVKIDPDPVMGWFQGLKLAGTEIPNHFRAGMFYQEGNKVFWDIHNSEKTVVVTLADERYGKLIIEVEDPQFVFDLLNQAILDRDSQANLELDSYLETN